MPYFELKNDEISFPPAYFADIEGLLAVGGQMSVERLLLAYNSGIFYWHFPLKHIKWWSPDPRIVLIPEAFDIPVSRWETLNKEFTVTMDSDFEQVLRNCQQLYNIDGQMDNRWLTERMFRIFTELHNIGKSHSVEVWKNSKLVGGLFGVANGKIFFGEYLFSTVDSADELAVLSLVKHLKQQRFRLLDMQKQTFFLPGIEYDELPRLEYVGICKENASQYKDAQTEF
ncbi:leucyl/phenylalanyl-tRNA--protein transferase [Flagellimonas zhangzhouensis]|uniref:Leucyl/phenylalanyl-tRNA--protein transferase n=1 Tax=Flagellimonas zhangzhouensis TaxID=1073328 RepID=A0A1H2QEI5_9FLAO|nr:leucyl/phenylalanyl-tRNA--protein transferase [Allomuricauda zhangzhouensis]SDQ51832.1 leucyl/phenylalanyl-tRNA--protein transferase [Allomuricauda zhangzhouensis]SDW05320.1 leucyl/phenylalanyl-tRNA--protein transferase [Allomuricauda zhangzhouensis]